MHWYVLECKAFYQKTQKLEISVVMIKLQLKMQDFLFYTTTTPLLSLEEENKKGQVFIPRLYHWIPGAPKQPTRYEIAAHLKSFNNYL